MVRNRDIAEDFARGIGGRTANLFVEDRAIYSYGFHFPIAFRLLDGVALFNQDGYSNTTSRHKSMVARALQSAGYKLEFVKTKQLKDAISRGFLEFKDIVLDKV